MSEMLDQTSNSTLQSQNSMQDLLQDIRKLLVNLNTSLNKIEDATVVMVTNVKEMRTGIGHVVSRMDEHIESQSKPVDFKHQKQGFQKQGNIKNGVNEIDRQVKQGQLKSFSLQNKKNKQVTKGPHQNLSRAAYAHITSYKLMLRNLSFSSLSLEDKQQIIEIIKQDTQNLMEQEHSREDSKQLHLFKNQLLTLQLQNQIRRIQSKSALRQ